MSSSNQFHPFNFMKSMDSRDHALCELCDENSFFSLK